MPSYGLYQLYIHLIGPWLASRKTTEVRMAAAMVSANTCPIEGEHTYRPSHPPEFAASIAGCYHFQRQSLCMPCMSPVLTAATQTAMTHTITHGLTHSTTTQAQACVAAQAAGPETEEDRKRRERGEKRAQRRAGRYA